MQVDLIIGDKEGLFHNWASPKKKGDLRRSRENWNISRKELANSKPTENHKVCEFTQRRESNSDQSMNGLD